MLHKPNDPVSTGVFNTKYSTNTLEPKYTRNSIKPNPELGKRRNTLLYNLEDKQMEKDLNL